MSEGRQNESRPPYPMHWEADVVLRDGATAHLRPINPDDAQSLERFHDAQSPESIYLRFFAPMPHLSARDVHYFTHVDNVDRVAFVCTVGDVIVGIARYDRLDARSAEVAFNVADRHHGRGLSSVLLEHLAAAARENGVAEFVAEVLPSNRRMLTVFRLAGYEVVSQFDDGVIQVRFALEATERSLAVMEAREHRAESRSMERLLNPASVAVIGASRRPGTVGHRLLSDLLAGGFTGRLHVVHPEADVVLGVQAVRRLDQLGESVDLAVIAVSAQSVLDVVEECAAAGVHGLVVVAGGFAETGPEGLARQRELVRLARANGLRVVGPNSWGLINADPAVRLNVSLVPQLPRTGRLGLFSQSGGLSVAVLDAVARRGLGVSTFLSAGNRADVSGNDCMQYWEEDPRTDVVGLYLESFGNPRKFSRIARRLARSKPVIVLKSGLSGFSVPPGHAVRPSTAPRAAFDSMLKQSGCIRVETLNQMLDVAQLVLNQPLPQGPRVGIVGNSDALGTLIADACVSWELDVVHGPVALHPQAGPEQFRAALAETFAAPGLDAVVAAFIPPIATDAREVARALAEISASSSIPVVACFLGSSGMSTALAATSSSRLIPSYPTPEEAVRALATAQRYAAWRRRDPGRRLEPAGLDLAAARAFVAGALAAPEHADLLAPEQVGRLLATGGIAFTPDGPAPEGVSCMIRTVEDPLFGPVVSFGLSGDASELLGDVAHRIPPLTDVDVCDLVRSVRAAPKLFGHHGAEPVDVLALEDLIGRISCLADELPELAELELDPVVVGRHGLSVRAARVRLTRTAERSDTARRELPAG